MSCYFDSYFLSGKQAAVLGTEPGQRPGGQSRNLPITDQSLRQEMGTFQGGRLPYPHLPTHCPCSGRRGCADPWLCWSQRVLSSNPPKSLPGIGISPELVYNLAASCTVVGHTCQVFVTDRNFLWCHPHPYNVRAGENALDRRPFSKES